jgi:hypothetical protein
MKTTTKKLLRLLLLQAVLLLLATRATTASHGPSLTNLTGSGEYLVSHRVTLPTLAAGDEFGCAVANIGDLNGDGTSCLSLFRIIH